jgi:hypothetical protein
MRASFIRKHNFGPGDSFFWIPGKDDTVTLKIISTEMLAELISQALAPEEACEAS